ncbi:MAG: DUF6504 family protein [Actinobacteria bacterium]|nr:DUF6504 family protein [Actinomycetota bacterium]MCA1720765.1 DUF6504 family protein [Actinomycetota bacterium]
MTRLHADPVEVRRRDDVPEQFLWRGRLYVVREVLARWTEAGGWWRGDAVRALTAGDGAPAPDVRLQTAPIPASPKWAQRAWGEPAPDVGASVGPAQVDDHERDWWRVEADSGRASASSGGTGVYDLCFDGTRGAWSLARVLD